KAPVERLWMTLQVRVRAPMYTQLIWSTRSACSWWTTTRCPPRRSWRPFRRARMRSPGAGRRPPDVVLMNVELPGIDCIEATRRIRAASPGTRVVVLTAMQNLSLIISAMAAGACGYLSKTRAADDLVDVVRREASGEIVMSDDELPIVL